MPDDVRISPQTLAILSALLTTPATPAAWRYGYDLSRETGLKSGTLYPILMRLAERGWLETRWEHSEENGKPRHIYRLTADGADAARRAVETRSTRVLQLKPAYFEA